MGSHRIGGRWNWALLHNWREVELGSPTELEVDGAGLSYRIGKRWSWALIQNWALKELRWSWALIQNWKEMELGSHTYRIGGR